MSYEDEQSNAWIDYEKDHEAKPHPTKQGLNGRKCYYCDNPATRRMTPDPDIYGVSLCDDISCYLKLMIELDQ